MFLKTHSVNRFKKKNDLELKLLKTGMILVFIDVNNIGSRKVSGVPREGGFGVFNPLPRNSEGPPKSRQTQPDCENC